MTSPGASVGPTRYIAIDLDGEPTRHSLQELQDGPVRGVVVIGEVLGEARAEDALLALQAHLRWVRLVTPWRVYDMPRRIHTLDRLGTDEDRLRSAQHPSYGRTVPPEVHRAVARINAASALVQQQYGVEDLLAAFGLDRDIVKVVRHEEPDDVELPICTPHHVAEPATIYRRRPDSTIKPAREVVADLVHVVAHRLDDVLHDLDEPIHDGPFVERMSALFTSLGTPRVVERRHLSGLRIVDGFKTESSQQDARDRHSSDLPSPPPSERGARE